MGQLSGTIVGAVLVALSSAQGTVVIDDFTTGPTALDSPGTAIATGLPTDHVIGGIRQMTLGPARTVGITPPGFTISFTVDTNGGGSFVVDGVPNATPIRSGLVYNGNTTSTPLMDIDLAPNGETGLVFDFAYADFSPDSGLFDLSIFSGSFSGGFGTGFEVPSSPTPFSVFFPFRDSLDEHHVTYIEIGTSNGYWFNDFALTRISSGVPEPATLVLLVLGGVGACSRRGVKLRRGGIKGMIPI